MDGPSPPLCFRMEDSLRPLPASGRPLRHFCFPVEDSTPRSPLSLQSATASPHVRKLSLRCGLAHRSAIIHSNATPRDANEDDNVFKTHTRVEERNYFPLSLNSFSSKGSPPGEPTVQPITVRPCSRHLRSLVHFIASITRPSCDIATPLSPANTSAWRSFLSKHVTPRSLQWATSRPALSGQSNSLGVGHEAPGYSLSSGIRSEIHPIRCHRCLFSGSS